MTPKKLWIAIILLPIFFLLQNYNEVIGFLGFRQILVYATVIYGLLAIGYWVLFIFRVDQTKSLLILFVISICFLFFTPIHEFIHWLSFNTPLGSYWVVFPLILFFQFWLIRKIIKSAVISLRLVNLLNLIMVFLVLSSIVTLFINYENSNEDHNLIYPGKPISDSYTPVQEPDSSKPDIYFLLFDEYTNGETLKKIWNYDNSGIEDWLKQKGFYVADSTKTNYNFTLFSLSSIFNMSYLNPKKGIDGTVTKNVMKANQSLSDNEVFSILQKENYSIHFFAPFRNHIEENQLGHFFDFLIDEQMFMQTLPGSAMEKIRWRVKSSRFYQPNNSHPDYELVEKHRLIKRTIEEIKGTTDSTVNRKPHFVYGHLMITHIPHVFDSLGKIMTEKEILGLTPFQTYTAQITYANQVIKELVSYIQSHNKRKTIVIIVGDHGFRHFTPELMPIYSFPNLSTVYFPDMDYSQMTQHLSPVNLFRVVFDKYFGLHLPILKDSCINVKDEP